ncbi:MAG: hypothetical protein M3397_02085 [Actinomycetota bacterium]|jgi:hypothetical protein|nr:hypothetical protein [Actinomycetota bacterium]
MADTLNDTASQASLPKRPGRSRTPRLILASNVALAGLLTILSLAGFVEVTDPSAYIGMVLLVGTLLPSNLLRFGRFSHGRRMRALAKLRKPLGISAGVWFVVHSAASVWEHFDLSLPLGPQFARTGIVLGISPSRCRSRTPWWRVGWSHRPSFCTAGSWPMPPSSIARSEGTAPAGRGPT